MRIQEGKDTTGENGKVKLEIRKRKIRIVSFVQRIGGLKEKTRAPAAAGAPGV
jgi:hypothetical protein